MDFKNALGYPLTVQPTSISLERPTLDQKQDCTWSWRAQDHEAQVRHRLVPDLDPDFPIQAGGLVLDDNLLLLRGDQVDGLHEPVGQLRDPDEQEDEDDGVEDAATGPFPDWDALVHLPHGQQDPLAAVDVWVRVGVVVGGVADERRLGPVL